MLKRLAHLSSHYPRRVLLFWALLWLIAVPLSGRLEDKLSTNFGVAPGSVAGVVRDNISRAFAGNSNFQLVLLAEKKGKAPLDADTKAAEFSSVIKALRALDIVASVRYNASGASLPIPNDITPPRELAVITIKGADEDAARRTTRQLQKEVARLEPPHLNLLLTGRFPAEEEVTEISRRDALHAELFGLPISLLILAVAFGAIVAATLPLIVAVLSIFLALAILGVLANFFTFAVFAQIVITMLGLASGIDYALLMVNRFREELATGLPSAEAAEVTTTTAGQAVIFSGFTVLIALSALLIPPLSFVKSIGVASIIIMLLSVSISVTALPAALTLLGENINRIHVGNFWKPESNHRFWETRASMVTRHPWLWTIFGVAILLLLAAPVRHMNVAFSGTDGLTMQTETRRAQALLKDAGLDNVVNSFNVLLDFGERGFFHPSSVRASSRLSRMLAAHKGVAFVLSPNTTGNIPPLFVSGYYANRETALESPLAPLIKTTVSEDGRYALVRVIPESGQQTSQLVGLESAIKQDLEALELQGAVGGNPVFDREWVAALYGAFPFAIAVVYLLTFIILGLAFRSVLIPLKSILLNTLTVAAAYGVITAVFQDGWGAHLIGLPGGLGFVETSAPVFIFAIVFGLSMDYEVFLVSRIVEHHLAGASDRVAVVKAVSVTGGVITSAALIMGVVFFVFLFSHVVLIKTLSLGLTVAILLDATLVRLILVPAVMMLAGKWNWWLPKPVARLAKKLDLGHH